MAADKEAGMFKSLGNLAAPIKHAFKRLPWGYVAGGAAGALGTSSAEYNYTNNERANIAASQESLEKQMREEEEKIRQLMTEMQRLRR